MPGAVILARGVEFLSELNGSMSLHTMLAIDDPYNITHISDELKARIDGQLRVYWERDGQSYERLTYDSLMNFTTKHHGFLTGGFVLQCLLGEDYDGDIDIFVPHDDCARLDEFEVCKETKEMTLNSFVHCGMPLHARKRFTNRIEVISVSTPQPITFNKEGVRCDYPVSRTSGVCHGLEGKNSVDGFVINFCRNNFDFPVCANGIYEGMLIYSREGEKSLEKRETYANDESKTFGSVLEREKRIEKYESRGFKILNKTENLEKIRRWCMSWSELKI